MPASRVGVMPQPNQMPQRNVNRKDGGGTAGRQKGITMEVRRLVSFVFLSFIVEKKALAATTRGEEVLRAEIRPLILRAVVAHNTNRDFLRKTRRAFTSANQIAS